MPESNAVTRIRIFISSPGDVNAERDALKHLIEHDLQRTLGEDQDLYLEPVMWETHTIPGLGNIQENIFEQVGGFDVFIGFFWQRFGTPTDKYNSGSDAEFYKAYEMWEEDQKMPVMMYFCNKPYTPTAENLEQIAKVLQFKQKIAEKGLYWEYKEVADLKDLVRVHLHKAILGLLGEEDEAFTQETQPMNAAYRTYLDRLRRRCRLLPLGAFGFEHGAEDEVTLDEVYVNLLTTARKKVPKEKAKENESVAHIFEPQDHEIYAATLNDYIAQNKVIPVSALEAIASTNRLVLLGDPGSGKSTFVNQVLADFADARLLGLPLPADLTPDLVPVRIILRRFANELAIVDLTGLSVEERDNRLAALFINQMLKDLEEEWRAPEAAAALNNALNTGQVFLVLDGLDEIPSGLRAKMQQAVQALLKTYPLARTVITCRVRSYQEKDKHIAGFDTFTLAPFNNEQMQSFVTGWYNTPHSKEHFGEEKAKEKAGNLTRAVLGPALNDLASNPMLLTTMAVIHQRDIGLPDQRARLYELAVDVLLRRWQTHRGSDIKTSAALKAFLGDERRLLPTMYTLAYLAHVAGTGNEKQTDIRRGDALVLLEKKSHLGDHALAGEFLDYVDQRSGILVGQGGGDGEAPLSYSFPHRTFQEYLAGCHIVSQPDVAEALIEHAAQDDYWYVPVQMGLEELLHNRKQDWQLLRQAYQLCPSEFPEGNVSQQRLILWSGVMAQLVTGAFVCADTKTPGGGEKFFERLRTHLVSLLKGVLPPIERAEAGRVLGRLGDPREGVVTIEAMPFCYVPKGPFLLGSREDDKLAYDWEKNQTEIDLLYDYWIGQYPVTQSQFQYFVDAGGYKERKWWTELGWAYIDKETLEGPQRYGDPFDLPNHPVVGVSWYEAYAYTQWLTQFGREKGWLSEHESICLANEPEWEKAARGGYEVPESFVIAMLKDLGGNAPYRLKSNAFPGRRYSWGDEIEKDNCNYEQTGIGRTTSPGCFDGGASPYGLHDMSGNVWEWSRSLYDDSLYGVDSSQWQDREASEGGSHRVIRGGSWNDIAWSVRSAYRGRNDPGGRYDDLGFRLVRTVL